MRFVTLASFALACSTTTPVKAFTSGDLAVAVYSRAQSERPFVEAKARVRIAEAIQSYWNDFDTKLPRLSPSETDWLTGELNSQNSDRISRAMQSREYALWVLELTVDGCLEAIQQVIGAQQTEELRETEMYHWTAIVDCYIQSSDDTARHLRGAGLIDSVEKTEGFTYDGLILDSLIKYVLPSAMAETMGWQLNSRTGSSQ